MIKQNRPLTYERLKEVIEYNPETGEFFRLESHKVTNLRKPIYPKGKAKLVINIDGERYAACRLAIMYSTGELPLNSVYHKNHDKKDFILSNLYLRYSRKNDALTQIRLKELFKYDPTTGYFFRKGG